MDRPAVLEPGGGGEIVPGGGGVLLLLLSGSDSLMLGEVGLITELRGAVLDRALLRLASAWQGKGFGKPWIGEAWWGIQGDAKECSPTEALSTRSLCRTAGWKACKDEVLDIKPAYRSTLALSHESPMDQDLWMGNSRAGDGGDTASSEGGRVPRGGGVPLLLNSEPGPVVEVVLIVVRGAVLD